MLEVQLNITELFLSFVIVRRAILAKRVQN